MKRGAIAATMVALVLLLVLPAAPACADLTPGHMDTGFDPGTGADNVVLAIAVQPDGKVLVGGHFTTMGGVARNRIARLDADGALDTAFDPGSGADGRVRAIAVQSDGKVIIGGSFSTVDGITRNRIARLDADGALDTSFDPGAGLDNAVRTVVVLADGKILIGGDFTTVDGVARTRIARLNADGSLDTGFDPGAGPAGGVYATAIQADGKIIIGGGFSSVDGVGRNRIARLDADGALDTSFDPGTGANNLVEVVALQPNDRVIIGGLFSTFDGMARTRIARLNADGSLDATFDPGSGGNATIHDLKIQGDGKVVIGGAFSTFDGVTRNRIARLDRDGSVDASFDPGTGADDNVWAMALQVDGKVLMGGDFGTVDGTGRNRIARLHGDGSLNAGFDAGTGASNQVQAVALQTDGKVLIGGFFTTVDGVTRNRVARLDANGSLDSTFAPTTGPNGSVRGVAIDADDKIIIGGNFTTFDGIGRNYIARLDPDGSLDTTFDPGTGADDTVMAVAVHHSRTMIGGYFTTVDGTARNGIARLHADGSLDTGFDPGSGANGTVLAVAVQSDGKVVIGGNFTAVDGVARPRIARLNADGSVDMTFDPGSGANLLVRAVVIEPDDKVLIGGSFTTVGGVARNRIARLNADGTLDTTFDPGTGADNWVDAVARQSDRKVIIAGDFTAVDGTTCNHVARLDVFGNLDTGFDTSVGADDTVYDVAVQPDGQLVIGGDFANVDGVAHGRVARLNGATAPMFTSGAPASPATTGVAYQHRFRARGYPWAPSYYVTGGSLPPGLALDTTTGQLAGVPTTCGDYLFTVSACNFVAPCDTQAVQLTVEQNVSFVFLPLVQR